ncbi:MAG: DNA polymerase [Bacilli bacterium]|nr:DNA polymerase [Bacilli bacterium]
MKELFIDLETYSDVDLSKSGVYRYAQSSNFEILLFAYSVDKGPVQVINIKENEQIPTDVLNALTDNSVKKYAYNAVFERICLSKYLGYPIGMYLSPNSWYCDMVHAATLGLPLSLENVGIVLGIEKQKLTIGKSLIKYFCIPCTPTKANGYRTRNLPHHDRDKWNEFIKYNKRDVETEMEIHNRLAKFQVLEQEWDNYHLDQRINDYGIMIDLDFVNHAIRCDEENQENNIEKVKLITGVNNPNSPKQLKEWLIEQGMTEIDSLSKADVTRLLKDATGNVEEILKLRQDIAKSSVKKYIAMQNVVCKDDRCRGLIQFYGANRTGRYAGRLIQMQNLPQNHLEPLSEARELIRMENLDGTLAKFGAISTVLSELIRTAFIPKKGYRFIVSDFSAIEARVLAWLAKEEWRLELFRNGGDIYCMSASKMFGVPVEKNGINKELRQKGKIAELACGYGGSVGALKAFGAIALGIKEIELKGIIDKWREANPNIIKLWWEVDKTAKNVITNKSTLMCYGLKFSYEKGIMFIELPSKRRLAYCKPRIGINALGLKCITYEGIGTGKKWERIESYGPKLVENIVQGIARDILAEAMMRLYKNGYKITMHIHDEVVLEVEENVSTVEEVCRIMKISPIWAKDLPLNADGYECKFYKKE